jgi:hypothetical protein
MKTPHNLKTTVSILLIFLTCLFALNRIMPRVIINDSVPSQEFSMSRALDHLKIISEKPHFVSSPAHEEVREYLVSELEKLGLEVEIQETQVLGQKNRTGTKVRNILTRIKGSEHGKALMLLSHYDSEVSTSYGASDAGSGVVSILESLRAFLAKGTQPKNDIIVLISDAEELGLLGAQGFVDEHPWSKDVGLVLNFEARGSGGPVVMFVETNQGNKNLIRAFDQAHTSRPFSNSLFYSVYKLLPNDTDLTIFRKNGDVPGYNFAFIDDHFDYHTAQDNYERLDRNTLQHLASYLMPALTYFAMADLNELSSETDLVFFNFPGMGLINYPFSWVLPMCFLGLLALISLVAWGMKKHALSFREMAFGFIPLLLVLSSIGLGSFYGWKLLLKIHPGYREIVHGFTYNGHLYVIGFVSLALWLTLWIYQKYLVKRTAVHLFFAPLVTWLLINFAMAVYLPGAGFFALPLFTGIIIFWLFISKPKDSTKKVIVATILSLPTLLIMVPLIEMFPIALGLQMVLIATLISSLVLLLLLPIWASYAGLKNLNKLFLITALLVFASASFTAGFDEDSKRPDSIIYLRNEANSIGYWGSRDLQTDEFTRQFLGENPVQGRAPEKAFTDAGIGNYNYHKPAASIDLEPTRVEILSDTVISDLREVRIRVQPARTINRIDVNLKEDTRVVDLAVFGQKAVKKGNSPFLVTGKSSRRLFQYYFSDDRQPLVFTYSVPIEDDPSLFMFELTYDFENHPEIKKIKPDLEPRPAHLMPNTYSVSDAVVNLREISFHSSRTDSN